MPGVSEGDPNPALRGIAVPTTAPGQAWGWRLTAGWSARTREGIAMPGRGRPSRAPTLPARGHEAHAPLGALDVWMNGASYWRNIP